MNKNYMDLTDNQKYTLIQKMYQQDKKSFIDIAKEYNTYPNKIRRDAIRLNIDIRNKSEAQKNALITGKTKHPTKGTTRSELTKQKIGESVMTSWQNSTEESLLERKQKAKKAWNELSEDQKTMMQQKANQAVRQTSKVGSKLEKYILDKLLADGYRVNFHQEQSLLTTKLQIDLFLPTMNVAIEIDGPSHFLPVWGEDILKKNQAYDQKKEGLILGKGLVLIRIKQLNDFSKTRAEILYSKLLPILKQIESQFPAAGNRSFTIED